MRLTRTSGYALQALDHLVSQPPEEPVASRLVAAARGIPEQFNDRVLLLLADAGILRPVRGPHGGYRLAKPAQQITLLDVVEAVDGPIRGEVPPVGQGANATLDRRLQQVCDETAALVRGRLAKVTLAELARAR
jgi:Rrf2 family protein